MHKRRHHHGHHDPHFAHRPGFPGEGAGWGWGGRRSRLILRARVAAMVDPAEPARETCAPSS